MNLPYATSIGISQIKLEILRMQNVKITKNIQIVFLILDS